MLPLAGVVAFSLARSDFRRVDRAFRGVTVFDRVRGNLGFRPTPSLSRFPDLATGNCAAKPFGAAAAMPETIRAFRPVRGVAGINEDSHQNGVMVERDCASVKRPYKNGTKSPLRFKKIRADHCPFELPPMTIDIYRRQRKE